MNRNNRYNNGNNTNKYRNDDSNKGTGTGNGPSFASNYDNGNGNGNGNGNRYDNRRPNRNNTRNDNGYSNVNEYQNSGLNINRNEIISKPDTENVVDAATNGTDVSVVDNYTPKEFDKWEDLENIISEDLMRGIYAYGFDMPSLIQRKATCSRADKLKKKIY